MRRVRFAFDASFACSGTPIPRHWRRALTAPLIATLALAVGFLGCSVSVDGRYPVEGEVKFQGAPLAKGTVQFVAIDGSSMTGGDIVDGKFAIPAARGAKPGEYVVRISSVDEKTVVETMPGDAGPLPVSAERIPAKWNVESEEKREIVASSENRFAFDIP
jgi:hypothetical protein